MAGAETDYFPGSHKLANALGHVPILGRQVVGSGTPDFVRLKWTPAELPTEAGQEEDQEEDKDAVVMSLMELSADPKAGLRPRGWRFSVIGIEHKAFREVVGRAAADGATTENAIVCLQDGEIVAGTNPDGSGHLFGGTRLLDAEGTLMITAAVRHGRDALRATLGEVCDGKVYVPDVPPLVLDDHVRGGEVPYAYPRTLPAG